MKVISLLFLLFLAAQPPKLASPALAEICLSAEEKKLYELIMQYRKSKKLKPIPYSPKLTQVAQLHVKDLNENYDYANRGECNPHSWSDKGKWATSCCYTSTPDDAQKECMWNKPREITGYSGNGFEIAYYSSAGATADEGLEGWKKSPGHNPLLINSGIWEKVEWKGVGIGILGEYGVVWFGDGVDEIAKIVICN